MKPFLALLAMAATSVYGQEPVGLCNVTGDRFPYGVELVIRSHITPTMHTGLQLSDRRCAGTLIKLINDERNAAQRAALSKAFEARLYARPYSIVVTGRIEALNGQRVVNATTVEFSPNDP